MSLAPLNITLAIMAVRQRHVSPDGVLVLTVDEMGGDFSVGFEGFEWHTHGDLLTPAFGDSAEEAVSTFVGAILDNQLTVAVERNDGATVDIRVVLDPEEDLANNHLHVTLRLWDKHDG